MKKTNKRTAEKVSSILIFLLVVLVIGFFAFRTNNFTTGMKDFYVSCNGREFMTDYDNYDIVFGKEYKFEVHNEKDKLLSNESKYYVQVLPNQSESNSFNFYVDNIKTSFAEVESLSKYFIINAREDYFTFKAIDYELIDMLKAVYETENIIDCPTIIDSGKAYLSLVISSGTGETIKINFNIRSE